MKEGAQRYVVTACQMANMLHSGAASDTNHVNCCLVFSIMVTENLQFYDRCAKSTGLSYLGSF